MESKKDMIDELKAFNKALEKHLPNLDLDYVKDLKTSTVQKEEDEYFALLANNLMELRTEMALTRKNLSTEVESMVLRTVSEQQSKFFEQIKKFYGVIILDVKENIATHLKNLNGELNNLKRKYTDISVQNENLVSLLDDVLIDVKETVSNSEDNANSVKDMNLFTKARFEEFSQQLDRVGSDMNKRKFYFEDNLVKLNKRLVRIESLIEEIAIDKGIQSSYPKIERYKEEEDQKLDQAFQAGLRNAQKVKENVPEPSLRMSKEEIHHESTMNKIEEIEKKLEDLNSLRKEE